MFGLCPHTSVNSAKHVVFFFFPPKTGFAKGKGMRPICTALHVPQAGLGQVSVTRVNVTVIKTFLVLPALHVKGHLSQNL